MQLKIEFLFTDFKAIFILITLSSATLIFLQNVLFKSLQFSYKTFFLKIYFSIFYFYIFLYFQDNRLN